MQQTISVAVTYSVPLKTIATMDFQFCMEISFLPIAIGGILNYTGNCNQIGIWNIYRAGKKMAKKTRLRCLVHIVQ